MFSRGRDEYARTLVSNEFTTTATTQDFSARKLPAHSTTKRTQAVACVAYMAVVTGCYFLAACLVSPQLQQADRPPYNVDYSEYTTPTLNGGGYCFSGNCDSYNGVYKPPWFYNPTQSGAGVYPKHQIYVFAFYVYLALIGFFAAAKLVSPGFDARTRRPLPCSRGSTSSDLLLWAATLSIIAVFFVTSAFEYLVPIYTSAEVQVPHTTVFAWAMVFAQQCNLLVGLVLLPVTKHSLVASMYDSGWEKMQAYHRWLGTYFLLCIFTHALLMLVKWLNDPHGKPPYNQSTGTLAWITFRQNLFGYAYYQHGAVIWGWSLSIMCYCLMFVLPFVAIAAVPLLRRRFYRAFYLLHLLLPPFVVATLAHSWTAWQFAIAGLILYTIDKLAQLWQLAAQLAGCRAVTTARFAPIGRNTVTLTLRQPGGVMYPQPQPGQTMYLYVPAVSGWWPEMHPFTAVADFGSEASTSWRHYITASKNGRWTDKLLALAHEDGPEGQADPMLLNSPIAGVSSPDLERALGRGIARPGEGASASLASVRERELPKVYVLGPFGAACVVAEDRCTAMRVLPDPYEEGQAAGPPEAPRGRQQATLLFAAGAGITPIAALLEAHLRRRGALLEAAAKAGGETQRPALTLVWAVRDLDLLQEFVPLLDMLLADEGGDALHLYYTGEPGLLPAHAVYGAAWRPQVGRPDVNRLIAQARQAAEAPRLPATLHVHCCGPTALASSVQKACAASRAYYPKIIYHPENFEL